MQMLCHKDFAMMSNVVNERKNQAFCHRVTVSHHWIRNLERGLGKCCFFKHVRNNHLSFYRTEEFVNETDGKIFNGVPASKYSVV